MSWFVFSTQLFPVSFYFTFYFVKLPKFWFIFACVSSFILLTAVLYYILLSVPPGIACSALMCFTCISLSSLFFENFFSSYMGSLQTSYLPYLQVVNCTSFSCSSVWCLVDCWSCCRVRFHFGICFCLNLKEDTLKKFAKSNGWSS